ncbi:hypothetical protein [Clostridium beijerinckii]|uniref:hypothetical protein n=1 Tax=Clostridium beijerinckii TaxID=1520 RepID=UPI0022E02AA1|nr:hypothetical protein [Clostridium beijerinckii]
MRRKKNGSSLIYVIIIFMFITTVSTAVLSMVYGNYTARVIEGKRVENLYGSDSGIDVAYNILGKTFDAATKYGYYRVKTLTDTTITDKSKCTYGDQYGEFNDDINKLNEEINKLKSENNADGTTKTKIQANNRTIDQYNKLIEEDKNFINVLLNEEFKSGFKAFFDNNDSKLNSDFKLKNSIERKQYVYEVPGLELSSNDTTIIQYDANSDTNKEAVLGVNISEPYNINTTESDIDSYGTSSKDGHIVPVVFTKTVNKAYNIKITSNFRAKNDAKIVRADSNRTVEATYVIKIPNYDDIFFGRGTSNDKYLALENRGITVGNDMYIENIGQLTVGGNVFVQGKDPIVSPNDHDRTYDKYSGGITINNSSSGIVYFNNNVITRNTFNVQDNTTATIKGNLYGRNIYIGKIADGDAGFAQNSKLYINTDSNGKVVLDNDLTLKAKNSEIIINDFYGINDKNIKYINTNDPQIYNKLESDNVTKSSSSIIINGYKGGDSDSKVTINNSAYIMGTAHIATENNYQTGESGAIKDNYIAYSVLDPTDLAETFDDSQLHLLNEDNVFKKAEHFKNYWTEHGNADAGGIIWPNLKNIFSIGSIVYKVGDKTIVKEPNYTQSLEREGGKVYDMRKEFATQVYKFGQQAEIGEYNKSVLTDFDSLMNFNSIAEYIELGDNEKAVFNPDLDITIVLQDKDNNTTEFEDSDGNKIDKSKIRIIKADRNNNLNAVIATAGNVIIDGNVKFRGTIICKKDLIIKGNNNVTIDYDPDVISRLQSQNEIGEKFKSVFGGMVVNSDETSNSKKLEDEILNTNYDINKFMETKLWKIKS